MATVALIIEASANVFDAATAGVLRVQVRGWVGERRVASEAAE